MQGVSPTAVDTKALYSNSAIALSIPAIPRTIITFVTRKNNASLDQLLAFS